MPRRRFRKRRFRRRRMRRRRRRRRRGSGKGRFRRYNVRVPRPLIFPDSITVRLPYVNTTIFNTGTGVVTKTFSGNALNTPEPLVIGHQPLGFDEWALLYDSYLVFANKIKITFSGAATEHQVCAIAPYLSVTPPTLTITEMLEQPYLKHKYITFGSTGWVGKQHMSHYATTKVMYNEKSLASAAYQALNLGVPARQWYWQFFVGNIDDSGTPNLRVLFEMTYYVKMFRRRDFLTQS